MLSLSLRWQKLKPDQRMIVMAMLVYGSEEVVQLRLHIPKQAFTRHWKALSGFYSEIDLVLSDNNVKILRRWVRMGYFM